jgi:V/A-type H+-transporting ATPase subunit K
MRESRTRLRKKILASVVFLIAIVAVTGTLAGVRLFAQEEAQTALSAPPMTPEGAEVTKFAFLAAAIAFGLGAVGAGVAIGNVGAAAMGAVAEKPEVAGQALIFVALAEGLVIFGFITALMILGKA